MPPLCRTGKEVRCYRLRQNAWSGRRTEGESECKREEIVGNEAVVKDIEVNSSVEGGANYGEMGGKGR